MDSEEHTSAENAPPSGNTGPGDTLRAAREAQGLDLTHIAAQTRIPLRHLEAIEANDFESLPSRAYAIGFTRTYAKALGLDDVAVIDAVRAELADGSMRRALPVPGMEPGDPARLPSRGLAWASAAAVVVLAAGIFAFSASYFAPGSEPGSLIAPEPAAGAGAPAAAASAAAAAPAAAGVPSGAVVLTATEDGVWLRLYEEGGARLAERTLKLGESIEVPASARDPRINTGRADALSVTIGGQPVARLSERAMTVSAMPVSAAALAARASATPAATAASPAPAPAPAPANAAPVRVRPRVTAPASSGSGSGSGTGAGEVTAPAPANDAATTAEAPAAPTR